MNEWLKKLSEKLKGLWKNGKPVQKVILIVVAAVIVIAVVSAAKFSSKPTTVRVFTQAITDQDTLTRITDRIDEEHIPCTVQDGYIIVEDERTARKLQTLLVSENLVPSYVQPFSAAIFKRDWSTTDADQLIKMNKELQNELRNMIITTEGIRDASVIITRPEDKLFAADQKPVTASVKLHFNNGSDFPTNRRRILGLQRLILSAVEGLTEDNLVIANSQGEQLNDFEGMAESDRIDLVAKQQKNIHKMEILMTGNILASLQGIFDEDRIRNLNVKLEMDYSQKTIDSTKYSPIVRKEDNPDTPYDDSDMVDYLPLSSQTVTNEWQGTGYNPEGPAGVEGQTPPVYSDMSNVIGRSTQTGVTQNNVINTTVTHEESAPKPEKWSVSVNVDGTWKKFRDPKTGKWEIDENGGIKREYVAPTDEILNQVKSYIEGAIGYNRSRGDLVSVTAIQIDRTKQFEQEDEAYFAEIQRRRTIILSLISIAVILVGFILFRIISKEMERRRREREARLLAEQQAARERALWEAKDEGMDVTMSVEETRRMELQENAIAMAKEHPEDVAMLIRTWLMEE